MGITTLPPNKNLVPRFRRSSGSNRNSEQSHISSLCQHEVWMARMKEVLAFPSYFFFRVVAPLYFEELDCFTPRDTILLIQALDWVLGVRQISLERCHFRHDGRWHRGLRKRRHLAPGMTGPSMYSSARIRPIVAWRSSSTKDTCINAMMALT
jgi:hypothetical protein